MGKHSGGGGDGVSGGGTLTTGKMKVTVCFGNVRVIVPCSNPEMLVRDLIHQATLRYKKAAGKGQDSWVVVHKLKSQSDGGILDLDDKLIDVADDREQIMAIFEEDNDGIPSLQHNAGDGTSASSVGTNSPDIFQGTEHKFQPFARTDIEITGEELNNGMPGGSGPSSTGGLTLQVRRGSEPALNRLSPVHLSPPDPSKRWSAAPVIDADNVGYHHHQRASESSGENVNVSNGVILKSNVKNRDNTVSSTVYYHDTTNSGSVHPVKSETTKISGNNSDNSTKFLRHKSSGTVNSQINGGPSRFSRDSHRLSMQFFSDGSLKWADAADRAMCLSLRKEPVGANASPTSDGSDSEIQEIYDPPLIKGKTIIANVILKYESGPLGIHLVPEHNENGKNQGLIVQSVEKGGRIDRDGCLQAQDKIIEINGHSLIGVPFQEAQDLFRQGLSQEELKLKVLKHLEPENRVFTEMISGDGEGKENMVHTEEKIVGDSKVATVSSTRKSPVQAVPLSRPAGATMTLITSNTRKIGRKYEIDLQKGPQGLGFSITTRDNPAGGNCPIYIKYILPTGAAIDDGRLRPGDRLLEVNGIEITGKTQSEAVSILRNIPQGGIVKLVLSRQERVDLSPKLPRQIPPEKVAEDLQPVPWTEKEVLLFEIPVLDTEKAGLGISVKGKTATQPQRGMVDMGIFIKSVIHGGAASRDGRVKSNDQLLSVNGVSLLNCSNTQAMETLRRTMTQDGPKPKPGFITLTVARRISTSSAPTTDLSGCGSSASGDEMDSWGSKNVSLSVDGSLLKEKSDNVSPHRNNQINNFSIEKQSIPIVPSTNTHTDDLVLHTQNSNIQNVINRSRSSSLRKIDVLKGKFEAGSLYRQSSPSPMERVGLDLPRNPVLDRLTGKNNVAVRSESYYKATTETIPNNLPSESHRRLDVPQYMNYSPRPNNGMIVQNAKGEIVLLEDDYSAPQKPPRRSRSSTPEDTLDQRIGNVRVVAEVPSPVIIVPSNQPTTGSDVTYTSQTSLEDSGGFSRDAFGRQSMSEKRHATLDAKNTDTYQRNKKLREEREKHKQMQETEHDMIKSQKLAEERNLQDQWARRGVKRPFTSSTEDELANRASTISYENMPTPSPPAPHYWTNQLSNKAYLTKGKSGDRLGLGDQLLQLLHHWGQKRTQRVEAMGLPRVNSADSIVDSIKLTGSSNNTGDRSDRRIKGSIKDIGPSLGMKKSSSLESLQTMVQEIAIQDDMKSGYVPPRSGPQAVRVIRGRGCNESFRQAVDRSYEAPIGGLEHQMETLAEEETESCLSVPSSSGRNVRINLVDEDVDEKGRVSKKKPGLFRGLGSMFRFGRHRKPNAPTNSADNRRQPGIELENHEKSHYGSNIDQVQEQYRRLAEKRRDDRDLRHNPYGTISTNDYSEGIKPHHRQSYQTSPPSYHSGSGSMRIKQHHRKSVDSHEKDINGNPSGIHTRSASYDLYNEMTRPGSRVGFVDPKKYSHYINYEEIKHHLNDQSTGQPVGKGLTDVQLLQMRNTVVEQRKKAILESRRHQQHYHSQRRENPRERQERPVSNFYEYESVQAAMHSQQQSSSGNQNQVTMHHQGHNYPPANTLTMQQNQSKQNMNNNGVTLPSPTVPLSMGLRQISPSQFQAVPMFHQHQTSRTMVNEGNMCRSSDTTQTRSQRRPQQNSLPRRHQKETDHYNHSAPSQPQTHHRHTLQPHQFPVPGGRYPISAPPAEGSHSHVQSNVPNQMQNYHTFQQHRQVQPQSSSVRVSQVHQHSNGGMYLPSSVNVSIGSKV